MAQIGFGSTLEVSDATETTVAASTAAITIGELIAVSPPQVTKDIIDTTHMGSANTAREFIAGLIDYGEASFEINYNPNDTTDAELQTIELERLWREYQITFTKPDASEVTCTFKAIMTGVERSTPMDDKATASITLKVTGAPAWADVA